MSLLGLFCLKIQNTTWFFIAFFKGSSQSFVNVASLHQFEGRKARKNSSRWQIYLSVHQCFETVQYCVPIWMDFRDRKHEHAWKKFHQKSMLVVICVVIHSVLQCDCGEVCCSVTVAARCSALWIVSIDLARAYRASTHPHVLLVYSSHCAIQRFSV